MFVSLSDCHGFQNDSENQVILYRKGNFSPIFLHATSLCISFYSLLLVKQLLSMYTTDSSSTILLSSSCVEMTVHLYCSFLSSLFFLCRFRGRECVWNYVSGILWINYYTLETMSISRWWLFGFCYVFIFFFFLFLLLLLRFIKE